MSRALWLLTGLVLLTGCSPAVKTIPVPQVVRVSVPTYVPIPADLTQDCPIEEPKSLKVEEVVRVANARKVALQNCNVQLQGIRSVGQPPETTSP